MGVVLGVVKVLLKYKLKRDKKDFKLSYLLKKTTL
jgi:hypothetical protein